MDAALEIALSAEPFVPLPYRVQRVHRELADVVTLEVVPCQGAAPPFAHGQFNMLTMFGVGEAAISISGGVAGGNGFLHTVRDVGAVSHALSTLEAGAIIGLRGPFGAGWPVASAEGEAGSAAEGADVVIVAGGLGLAPLRSAIEAILAERDRYGHVAILFGCRHPADMLFRHTLEQWRLRLDVQVEVTVDHADAGWHGHVGVVPGLLKRVAFDPLETVALVCGPEVMMRFTAAALHEAGVPPQRIYLSMERNMKCAIGLCGHCQFGPAFVCKDGPVFRLDGIERIFHGREI